MLTRSTIEQVVGSQLERLKLMDSGLPRDISGFDKLSTHAYIISGIRRCGKSTLLQQIRKTHGLESIYLNFEDPRLAGFDLGDLNRLHEFATNAAIKSYFFDEIQNVKNWESFVRFRLDEEYRIFISGSNASMLSKELGTKLTGRHITKELFPFSYNEYLRFTKQERDATSSEKYLISGGFPEYLKTGLPEVLMHAFNDIVTRDISLRYNLKNVATLQQLAVWLVSNAAKPITGNSLKNAFHIGSSSSIMDYLSHFTDAWLFFFIPKFSFSYKAQLVNPKKVYCIDNGFISTNTLSFSDDRGRLLENMVFMHLRRQFSEIYYFAGKNECDFVVFQNRRVHGLYQVCWHLDQSNLDRELAGLLEAMQFFNLNTGSIITHNQSDSFTIGENTITAEPFFKLGIRN